MKYTAYFLSLDKSAYSGYKLPDKTPLSVDICKAFVSSFTRLNRAVLLPSSQFFDNDLFYSKNGFACLSSVTETNIPAPKPETHLFGHRVPNIPDPHWLDKQRAGVIVVRPHSVWKVICSTKPGMKVLSSSNQSSFEYGWHAQQSGQDVVSWVSRYVLKEVEFVRETFSEQSLASIGKFPIPPIHTDLVNGVLSDADGLVFDLLTNLAELPETLTWLKDLIAQVSEATKAAKKKEIEVKRLLLKKKRTAEQIAKALASIWMQYRYAIMPIVYSIEDIVKALESWRRQYGKASDKFVDKIDVSKLRQHLKISDDLYLDVDEASITHRCFIKRGYDPKSLVDGLLQILKLNPVTTAYELVPLSFVLDWFVNIGDFLTMATAPTLHAQQGATYSYKILIDATAYNAETDESLRYQYESYDRIVIDPYAEYGLTIGWDMNWKRYLDSISLALNPSLKVLKNFKGH